jgi:hypothetical protein
MNKLRGLMDSRRTIVNDVVLEVENLTKKVDFRWCRYRKDR